MTQQKTMMTLRNVSHACSKNTRPSRDTTTPRNQTSIYISYDRLVNYLFLSNIIQAISRKNNIYIRHDVSIKLSMLRKVDLVDYCFFRISSSRLPRQKQNIDNNTYVLTWKRPFQFNLNAWTTPFLLYNPCSER